MQERKCPCAVVGSIMVHIRKWNKSTVTEMEAGESDREEEKKVG